MKKIILILSIVAASSAVPLLVDHHALPEVGTSTQFRTEDNLGNYAFGYNEDHTSGGSFRKEVGDSLGNKIGSYGLHDADGRARVVNYVADGTGFKADVHTNEPGVDPSQDPADVTVNKPVVAAVIAPATKVVAAHPAIVAPVVTHKTVVTTPVVAAHPAVIAPVVTHKTLVTAPVVAFTPHHHSVAVFHAPLFLTPL